MFRGFPLHSLLPRLHYLDIERFIWLPIQFLKQFVYISFGCCWFSIYFLRFCWSAYLFIWFFPHYDIDFAGLCTLFVSLREWNVSFYGEQQMMNKLISSFLLHANQATVSFWNWIEIIWGFKIKIRSKLLWISISLETDSQTWSPT